jgi:hypothetical protein
MLPPIPAMVRGSRLDKKVDAELDSGPGWFKISEAGLIDPASNSTSTLLEP